MYKYIYSYFLHVCIYLLLVNSDLSMFTLMAMNNLCDWVMSTTDCSQTDVNLYGDHPFFMNMESDGNAHGVFLLNSNTMGEWYTCYLFWGCICTFSQTPEWSELGFLGFRTRNAIFRSLQHQMYTTLRISYKCTYDIYILWSLESHRFHKPKGRFCIFLCLWIRISLK